MRFRIQAPGADRHVEVEAVGGQIRLGRRAGLELELPFPAVSALHAQFAWSGAGWTVTDLDSANGTWLEGRRLPPGIAHRLTDGAHLRLADVNLQLEDAAIPLADVAETTGTIARRLVNDMFAALRGMDLAQLRIEAGEQTGQVLVLAIPDQLYKIGRAPHCDLVLDDNDVSREHAGLQRRWEGVFLQDLGSRNGILIQGRAIIGQQRVRDGDTFQLGASQIRLFDPEDRYLQQMQDEAAREPVRRLDDRVAEGEPEAALIAGHSEASPVDKRKASSASPPSATRLFAGVGIVTLVAVLAIAVWLFLQR